MIDIKELEILYFQNNKPVPYILRDGTEINIYPIKVEDWGYYEYCIPLLKIEKNDNPQAITMSYLEFLLKIISQDEIARNRLYHLVSTAIKEKNISFNIIKGKPFVQIYDTNTKAKRLKCVIDHKDFDNIKKIILFQNIVGYDDRYVSADVRKAIAQYEKIANKGIVSPTLEKQKNFVISETGMTEDKVNNMTYRSFSQVYRLKVEKDKYIVNSIMKASSKYDVKDEILHPLFSPEPNRFKDAFSSEEALKSKIG